MTTRRTAAKVTPETDIVDNTPETTETDTPTVEAPKTDITLEALMAAHNAEKAAFVALPNKGDIIGLLGENGQLEATAVVTTKPDTGAAMIQITFAANGRTSGLMVKSLTKIGENAWTSRNI